MTTLGLGRAELAAGIAPFAPPRLTPPRYVEQPDIGRAEIFKTLCSLENSCAEPYNGDALESVLDSAHKKGLFTSTSKCILSESPSIHPAAPESTANDIRNLPESIHSGEDIASNSDCSADAFGMN